MIKQQVKNIFEGIQSGNRRSLARGITLLESQHHGDRQAAKELLHLLNQLNKKSLRIGITGSPGVGKSTLLEELGKKLLSDGKKICVLAVDPSSNRTGGSILGDKTRMSILSTHENAYVRPSPSSGHQGGVAPCTREVLSLVEAFGFDLIFIETVGVGQNEVEVMNMVDLFFLMLLPHAGDELQGMKKGVMEVADLIFVNKEELNPHEATSLVGQVKSALGFFRHRHEFWTPQVFSGSAFQPGTLDMIWKWMLDFESVLHEKGRLELLRKHQLLSWFESSLKKEIWLGLLRNEIVVKELDRARKDLIDSRESLEGAIQRVLNAANY